MSTGGDLELRAAGPDDFEFVFAQHEGGLKLYIGRIWGWDEALQRRNLRADFDAGRFEIARRGERDVGMISLTAHADHLYLHHIVIVPECRGAGLGTALMRAVMARAAARGLPLRLSVFRGNPARTLYARLGFRVIREDDNSEWLEAP